MLHTTAIQIIRDSQQSSIEAKKLVPNQLDLIYAHNWFNIWVPQAYGGLGYTFQQGIDLLEDLAYYDGGLAWTITLCSGANMFAGFIEPATAMELFHRPGVCFGGSGRIASKAIWKDNHYVISGSWSFATGAPHLSHFTLNAPIYDGDIPRIDDHGNAVFSSFFVPRDQVLIHYDWNTFGLECTASHSFSLEKVRVSSDQAFHLSPDKRYYDSALYRIPFMAFAELTLLVNYMGMYRRFLDLADKYFFEKSKDSFWAEKFSKARFKKVDKMQQEMNANRTFLNTAVANLWQQSQNTAIAEDALYLAELSTKCKDIVASIRVNVSTLMPLLGIQAAQIDKELNIVFRNIFTATQHSLLNV